MIIDMLWMVMIILSATNDFILQDVGLDDPNQSISCNLQVAGGGQTVMWVRAELSPVNLHSVAQNWSHTMLLRLGKFNFFFFRDKWELLI